MSLKPIDLGNGILLFKDVLKDKKATYEFIKNSKNGSDPYFNKDTWKDWRPWGNYSKAYPMDNHSYKNDNSYGAELQKECLNVFFEILKIYKNQYFDSKYFEKNNIPKFIPESINDLETNGINNNVLMADFVIFETNINSSKNWQMAIHQDVIKGGVYDQNHSFNFNIYINDDYEGGDIIFFKHENVEKHTYIDSVSGEVGEAWLVEDYFEYKMQAGDGLIFPVDVYHGVKKLKEGNSKYYIRQFLSYIDGSVKHEKRKEYEQIKNASMTFEEYLNEFENELKSNRINPEIFNSLDSIAIDRNNDPNHTVVPCIIKSKKDISSLIQ
jgi:hypothetical protein